VGLVQRVLEAGGISTVTLSWIPDLTRAVGVPRLAGIGYPPGRPLGRPHDADGQRAVLRGTLELLERATGPDTYVELPFEWPESRAQAINASRDHPPPPIVTLLLKKPWLLPRLYSGRIPRHEEWSG
jgi:hypothetical protein